MDGQLFDDLVQSSREARDIAQGRARSSRSFVVTLIPESAGSRARRGTRAKSARTFRSQQRREFV